MASADPSGATAPQRPMVLGLAGGIGSGKSAVASILAELGFWVSDSDAGVRTLLARPDVRARVVAALGDGVVRDGRLDRRAIAARVFGDDAARRALEAILHPMLHAERADLLRRAAESGVRGVVVDAPLLFEAGVDAECDAVLFVETPRAERLARVRRRGWDEAELDRREAAQMPLDEKRRRSTAVVPNTGDLAGLRDAVLRALHGIGLAAQG
ncbi:MAG: dephospho-CoA kinase [Planctomycetota bacterium]